MHIRLRTLGICATIALLVADGGKTSHAGITYTIDVPGVQASTVSGITTETFNADNPGNYSTLATAVGTLTSANPGQFAIVPASSNAYGAYGGAGGTGNFFAVGNESGSYQPVTLSFNGPESYFGLWWSAADSHNSLALYSNGTLVTTVTTSNLTSLINASGDSSAYYGNPNNGQDAGEPFVYVNFYADSSTPITSAVFMNPSLTGFEADNFSVKTSVVPEPSSSVLGGVAAAIGALAWRDAGGPAETLTIARSPLAAGRSTTSLTWSAPLRSAHPDRRRRGDPGQIPGGDLSRPYNNRGLYSAPHGRPDDDPTCQVPGKLECPPLTPRRMRTTTRPPC